jgi:single-strand DNA-binding protein
MNQVQGTVNRVELIGWLGNDPEHRFLSTGSAICSFNLATKRYSGRTDNGERAVETEWVPVEAWEKLADLCSRSLNKGSRVRVVGSIQTRSWEDRATGQRRYKTVVRADDILFLDQRADAAPIPEEQLELIEAA